MTLNVSKRSYSNSFPSLPTFYILRDNKLHYTETYSTDYVFPLQGIRLSILNPVRGMAVCRECYVLSGRGLCVGLITRPEESYRVWCVLV
jgi:hypothetical protein